MPQPHLQPEVTMQPPSDFTLAAPSRVKVKFCGICTRRDLDAAVRFFADAVGFIFAPKTPRVMDVAAAAELSAAGIEQTKSRSVEAGGQIERFGVFVNEDPEKMLRIAEQARLSVIQLSGDEPPAQVAELVPEAKRLDVRVVKALHVRGGDTLRQLDNYPDVWACLLDAHVPGAYGGTGASFDWDLAAQAAGARSIILAGGLTPVNVADAIRAARPFMVDVSSGVEEQPRRKDHNYLLSFMQSARRAARELPEC